MQKKKRIKEKRRISNFGIFMITFFISLFALMGVLTSCLLKVQKDGGIGDSQPVCSEKKEIIDERL